MLVQIGKSSAESFQIGFLDMCLIYITMHLQPVARSYKHYKVGQDAHIPTLNVKEFFCAQVCSETCFCDDVVSQ